MTRLTNCIAKVTLKRAKTKSPVFKITSPNDVANFARVHLFKDSLTVHESFYVLYLNNSSDVIAYALISQGGISETSVDCRLIAKYGIELLATRCVAIHNHPAGICRPSTSDNNITEKLNNLLNVVMIDLLDHIIVTEYSFYSFKTETNILI